MSYDPWMTADDADASPRDIDEDYAIDPAHACPVDGLEHEPVEIRAATSRVVLHTHCAKCRAVIDPPSPT